MNKKLIEQGYKNFRSGDPITNMELEALINNHKAILEGMDKLNDQRFSLFASQLRHELYSLEGFKEARARKK